jgi:hypothetical protein
LEFQEGRRKVNARKFQDFLKQLMIIAENVGLGAELSRLG